MAVRARDARCIHCTLDSSAPADSTLTPLNCPEQGDSESLDGCGVDSQPANPINSTGFFHEVARRRWSPGIWVNGLALGAIIAATVIWLWPSERVAEDKPLLPASLGQREQVAELPDTSPPISAGASVPAAAPPAVPVPDATESGVPVAESRPLLPSRTVTTPLTSDPGFATSPQAVSKARPKVTGSQVYQTRSRTSRQQGQQASRIQSQPRVAQSRKGARFHKGTKVRRGWASTVPYPWEKPTTSGFNEK